jgi:hypothetical protein
MLLWLDWLWWSLVYRSPCQLLPSWWERQWDIPPLSWFLFGTAFCLCLLLLELIFFSFMIERGPLGTSFHSFLFTYVGALATGFLFLLRTSVLFDTGFFSSCSNFGPFGTGFFCRTVLLFATGSLLLFRKSKYNYFKITISNTMEREIWFLLLTVLYLDYEDLSYCYCYCLVGLVSFIALAIEWFVVSHWLISSDLIGLSWHLVFS